MMLHKAGFDTAVASMGTSLTFRQAKLLRNYTENVYISYDGDSAGQAATLRGLDILRDAGLNVKVITLPDGMDPDDLIKSRGREAYEKLISEALTLTEYKLESIVKKYDLSSPDAADSKSFKDNLNIIAIGEEIPLTDELIAELTTVLKAQYSAMFENFVLDSVEKSKIKDVEVLLIKGSYGVLNYAVKMEQVLYPAESNAYVMTCSYDAEGEKSAETIAGCRKAMESIQIKH